MTEENGVELLNDMSPTRILAAILVSHGEISVPVESFLALVENYEVSMSLDSDANAFVFKLIEGK
jgi:hypothetical protein